MCASRIFNPWLKTISKFTPEKYQMDETSGKFMYQTKSNGPVEICVVAKMASEKNPMRFGITVQSGKDVAHYKQEEMEHHLSHMQVKILQLTDMMNEVLRNADYAKELEVMAHNQSLSMHSASIWWPIMQVFILLLTGVAQASHMVRFFQSKRLI